MYTCFVHPRPQTGEQDLSDICPEPGCDRQYSWPLDAHPSTIGDYEVVKPLGRGFYAATYLVKRGRLEIPNVLKVTPAAFYELGIKRTDFFEESVEHKRVAEGTAHLAQIRDIFGDEEPGCDVDFEGTVIPCYVAVLDYVKGRPLGDYLDGTSTLTARGAAQIAIDLLTLLSELEEKGVQHNDLHESNILVEELPEDARRAQAVDETVRAVAIDFGSLGETSESRTEAGRLGDLHQVANHLASLSILLLRNPMDADDDDYRLASALDQLAQQMRPTRVNQRPVNFADQINLIRDTVFLTDSPWRDPGALPRFGEAYNAATLKSWYVPKLLVDPGGDWLRRISSSGPQLITGMRGCGKTMLLRALEVHGRAVSALEGGDPESLGERLEKDHWIGLYESATRLLDTLGSEDGTSGEPLYEPHARLLVAYARESVQAIRHLSHLDPGLAVPGYAQEIGRTVAAHLQGADEVAEVNSDLGLERALQRILISLSQRQDGISMRTNPSVAFPDLADAIRRSSPIWHDRTVYFLLDDVSTRNLNAENIRGLWSSLLFKDERCAFKMTTEAQTIEQLRSPGMIETAQIGRDVDVFYLDEEVNERTRQRGPEGGRSFIGEILRQRADWVRNHPKAHPEQVLGGGTLEAIAREIATAANASRDETTAVRQQLQGVYHGLNALSAICVGDIGDVIAIYETMLRAAPANPTLPLSPQLQSSAFQQYSRRRLYHLNRRGDDLRSFAAAFAKAAHELLRDSLQKGKGKRLRQYSAIHIQIDRDRQSDEYERILKLVDAGVFVFDPGQRPRLKSGDSDPTASFILNYRKLFGLFNYIGLAGRDRFELKGDAITEWLDNPDDHTVLTRRLGVPFIDGSAVPPPESDFFDGSDRLFSDFDLLGTNTSAAVDIPRTLGRRSEEEEPAADKRRFLAERVPHVRPLEATSLDKVEIDTLVIGLGFEERTLVSAQRLLDHCSPKNIVAVRYSEAGHTDAILDRIRGKEAELEIIDHQALLAGYGSRGATLVDTTGLNKALIFSGVREGLASEGRVWVAHTKAAEHWPLNSDIEPLLEAYGDDYYGLMEAMEKLNSGDLDGYEYIKLLGADGDQARARVLCAASTARHERLLSFVERREYDEMQISVPDSTSARGRIALIAAEIAGQNASSIDLLKVPVDDLAFHVRNLGEQYEHWYHRGREVELALTGSKMHAAACAAVASGLKLGQCWYVRPERFDTARFSRGAGETQIFEITSAPVS
jgi:tRNA A-37 threonylcarbamoyl transferase component Bud32